jgi:membrane protein DedA with SNARE-associated domain
VDLLRASIPAFVVVTVLALLAGIALRRRHFWCWAVPVSLFVGTLIGSIIYFWRGAIH